MEKDRIKTCIDVAKLYYESNYTQDQISKHLNISRPTVSRMINYCKEKNIVQIKIVNPFERQQSNEFELEKKYGLKKAIVAYAPLNNSNEILTAICSKAASYLNETVSDGDSIGVCWGRTLYTIAKLLTPRMLRGVSIVQLKGGVPNTEIQTYAKEIVDIFSRKFNGQGYYLPLPTLFSDLSTKLIVLKDPFISNIVKMGEKTNIALFTVGAAGENALLYKLGFFSPRDKRALAKVAAGDICSRLIDDKGQICDATLDARTNSIQLEILKQKDTRILVAGGESKLRAIKAALAGGYANVLITDQFTAYELL
mgnify:CR=1 FL=1